jgi:sterol carrier protein 2
VTAQIFGNAGIEYMEKYGAKPEHFAEIARINHAHRLVFLFPFLLNPIISFFLVSLSFHNHCPYFVSDEYIDHSSVNNPYSQFHDVYTLEQILASPVQHKFMTKLQCCPTSDGSAAVILCSQKFLDSHPELKSQVPQPPLNRSIPLNIS